MKHKKIMKVPTEEEWENYWDDLDTKYAYKVFYGKTNDEVQEEFKCAVLERAEELSYMPIKPFQYYVFGFKQFIESGQFDELDASDVASCFIRLIEDMLIRKPAYVKPILNELLSTLKHVAENQADYDADEEIYDNFNEIFENIQKLAKN